MRAKWLPQIPQNDVIVYVVSLDYGMLCFEDDSTPRILDSLETFEMVNEYLLKNGSLPVVLELTMTDALKEKLLSEDIPLSSVFSDYTGGKDYNAACQRSTLPNQVVNHYFINAINPFEVNSMLLDALSILGK